MLWSKWHRCQADGRTWNSAFHCQFLCLILRMESWVVFCFLVFFFPVYLNPCLSVFTALPPGLRILC